VRCREEEKRRWNCRGETYKRWRSRRRRRKRRPRRKRFFPREFHPDKEQTHVTAFRSSASDIASDKQLRSASLLTQACPPNIGVSFDSVMN